MARPKKPASERIQRVSVSFEKAGRPLRAFQKAIHMKSPTAAVNAAIRTCLQALEQKRLMREDFHLSQLHD